MICLYSVVSGPVSVMLWNSWLMKILLSNLPNCVAMNSLAIGVDDPHFTLSTTPWAIAAFSKAGAVSGVKSRMTPPPVPAAWTSCRMTELASVTGSFVGKLCPLMPLRRGELEHAAVRVRSDRVR